MACEGMRRRGQSATVRRAEVKKAIASVEAGLAAGRIKVAISPKGAIAFTGISAEQRDDVSDVCIYRQIMATGSTAAKAAIAKAEARAGRTVSKEALAQGTHSHDGGRTWHPGH
jgi:hypothetical protein